ncbi:MAG: NAD-binding protein [Proteobacteria bacterium]|nr:NAD-binding protein [Pseudomonadota bacterium]MBU4297104.1 NAD-binding protein [Pseudomonadota bacterium]MCG2746526.1 NAD-binding protein [Desulfobulbaceae bacterium]
MAEPDPKGVLIIGANLVALAVAKALREADFRSLLVDTSWDKISNARMEGFDTYYGEPVSEHADRHLDLVGLGRMLALSPRGPLNALSCMHYRMELGYNCVFALQVATQKELPLIRKAASNRCGHLLFGKDITFSLLAANLAKGWQIRNTILSATFTFDDLMKQSGGLAIALFAITPKGKLEIFTAETKFSPLPGWTVINLAPPADQEKYATLAASL